MTMIRVRKKYCYYGVNCHHHVGQPSTSPSHKKTRFIMIDLSDPTKTNSLAWMPDSSKIRTGGRIRATKINNRYFVTYCLVRRRITARCLFLNLKLRNIDRSRTDRKSRKSVGPLSKILRTFPTHKLVRGLRVAVWSMDRGPWTWTRHTVTERRPVVGG